MILPRISVPTRYFCQREKLFCRLFCTGSDEDSV